KVFIANSEIVEEACEAHMSGDRLIGIPVYPCLCGDTQAAEWNHAAGVDSVLSIEALVFLTFAACHRTSARAPVGPGADNAHRQEQRRSKYPARAERLPELVPQRSQDRIAADNRAGRHGKHAPEYPMKTYRSRSGRPSGDRYTAACS